MKLLDEFYFDCSKLKPNNVRVKVLIKQPRIKNETVSNFLQKFDFKNVNTRRSQSKSRSSFPIGSYMLNVYIFDVKFLQKN